MARDKTCWLSSCAQSAVPYECFSGPNYKPQRGGHGVKPGWRQWTAQDTRSNGLDPRALSHQAGAMYAAPLPAASLLQMHHSPPVTHTENTTIPDPAKSFTSSVQTPSTSNDKDVDQCCHSAGARACQSGAGLRTSPVISQHSTLTASI